MPKRNDGNRVYTSVASLKDRRPDVKPSRKKLAGQKYGSWTVLEEAEPEVYFREGGKQKDRWVINRKWKCICECGTVKNVRHCHLTRGSSKSCGCVTVNLAKDRFRELLERQKQASRSEKVRRVWKLYSEYCARARRSNLDFNLIFDDFAKMIRGSCYYCGVVPKPEINGKFLGIDRLENSIGYTVENSVSCCRTCNYAKHAQTQSEFTAWVQRVYSNMVQKQIIPNPIADGYIQDASTGAM